jgi:hypothetical protein
MRNGRCYRHGGPSTGPRTPEGLQRIVKARTVHGAYGAEMRELRRLMRALRAEQRRVLKLVKQGIEQHRSHGRLTSSGRAAGQRPQFVQPSLPYGEEWPLHADGRARSPCRSRLPGRQCPPRRAGAFPLVLAGRGCGGSASSVCRRSHPWTLEIEFYHRNILEGLGPVLIDRVQDPCGCDLHAQVVGLTGKDHRTLRLHGVERRAVQRGRSHSFPS